MAIINNYTSEEFGINSLVAYTKISSFYVNNLPEKEIGIFTETFVSKEARLQGKQPIGRNSYLMPFIEAFTFADLYDYVSEQLIDPVDDI